MTDADLTAPPTTGRRRQRELPKDVTAVRLQILAVQIMAGLHGWLGASSNGVIVVSGVVDGLGSEPITFQGKPYLGIKDGDLLPLGPANDPTDNGDMFEAIHRRRNREGRGAPEDRNPPRVVAAVPGGTGRPGPHRARS